MKMDVEEALIKVERLIMVEFSHIGDAPPTKVGA
jgi:hypothetical protein